MMWAIAFTVGITTILVVLLTIVVTFSLARMAGKPTPPVTHPVGLDDDSVEPSDRHADDAFRAGYRAGFMARDKGPDA